MGSPDVDRHAERLRDAGAKLLYGMVSDSGGVLRGKAVPSERIETFGTAGVGASLTWPVFCVDNYVAITDEIGVVGDLRLVADLAAAVVLDRGFAWAPVDVYTQDGERSVLCWRDVLRRQEDRLAGMGMTVLAGFEMEFTVLDAAGQRISRGLGWRGYGAGEFSMFSEFATQVVDRLAAAGVAVEQIHAEHGVDQYELSLPPSRVIRAADSVLLARVIMGRVARELGLTVSFSPMPFQGGAGNGAHVHLSMQRGDVPLLSGGSGPAGLTAEGQMLIAGLVACLPESIAVLAGSVVSTDRLVPGHWSGAYSCWGVENREAAVRLLAATRGNPHGANVEVKCVDGAANPYLAVGLALGIAVDGLVEELSLPAEVAQDPEAAVAAGSELQRFPQTAEQALALFEASPRVDAILGRQLKSAICAVRRHELGAFDGIDRYAATRFAWSA